MITAHLPSGFVLGRLVQWRGALLACAMAGAVFPDLDLLVFYFVDDRAVHHHRYWVHAPAFALTVSAAAFALAAFLRPAAKPFVLAFAAAWMLHLLLDTIAGDIMWLWPLSTAGYALFSVPGRDGVHFLVAFLTHWTILFELLVWLAALFLFRQAARDG